jgi:hypothetical protein
MRVLTVVTEENLEREVALDVFGVMLGGVRFWSTWLM